jgi:hypothetical protein
VGSLGARGACGDWGRGEATRGDSGIGDPLLVLGIAIAWRRASRSQPGEAGAGDPGLLAVGEGREAFDLTGLVISPGALFLPVVFPPIRLPKATAAEGPPLRLFLCENVTEVLRIPETEDTRPLTGELGFRGLGIPGWCGVGLEGAPTESREIACFLAGLGRSAFGPVADSGRLRGSCTSGLFGAESFSGSGLVEGGANGFVEKTEGRRGCAVGLGVTVVDGPAAGGRLNTVKGSVEVDF